MVTKHLYEFGPFCLDPAERQLLRDGEPVSLTPKCFDLLVVLVENNGHLLEKDELLGRLWPGQFVEESNLSFNISSLRKALGEGQDGRRFIETVPKKGFRFVAPVEGRWNDETGLAVEKQGGALPAENREAEGKGRAVRADEAGSSVLPPYPVVQTRRSRRSRIFIMALAAGTLGLLAYGLWGGRAPTPDQQPLRTIAVLPFKPLSAGSRDESLEMGMAETLITKLGGVKQIVVRPISAVRKYTDPNQDPVGVGRELQAEAVLDGSIQRSGDRVRVTVRLIETGTGVPLWAEQFDADFTGIFEVQDSISERVAKALALELSAEEKGRLSKRHTHNSESYQLYLQGHYLWSRRTDEGLRKSFEYYQRALEKDPKFALAHVGLAESHLSMIAAGKAPAREALPKVLANMTRALELDPTLAEARNALAEVKYQFEYDWPGAEREFKQAIELNPNAAWIRLAYGWFLMSAGRFNEAQAEMERAQELDPSSMTINRARGKLLYFTRQYDRAVEHYRKILEVEPGAGVTHRALAAVYEQKGMYAEAVEEAAKADILDGSLRPEEVEEYREVFRTSGWQGYWRKRAADLEDRSKRKYVPALALANSYARAGERDEALDWLEKAYEAREPVIQLKIDPLYDSFRSDPRCIDLLQRMNLEA